MLGDRWKVGRGRGVEPALERLLAGGHVAQLVQAQPFGRSLARDQVAMMDGVERAAEEPDGASG